MTRFDPTIDRILQFIEDFQVDPQTPPPANLNENDVALAHELARSFTLPAHNEARRARIWKHVLEEIIAQRRVQTGSKAATRASTHVNGRTTQEGTPMNAILAADTLHMPRQHSTTGRWVMAAVTAACLIAVVTVLFASNPTAPSPSGDGSGSGAAAPLAVQDATPTAIDAAPLPVIQATASIQVRQGPGLEYPVKSMLTEGGAVSVIGRTEDSDWYQVLLPDGSWGWIATPPSEETNMVYLTYGDIDTVPVIDPAEIPVLPTETRVLASPTFDPTMGPRYLTATEIVRQVTATAIDLSVPSTPNYARRIGIISGHSGPEDDPGAVCYDENGVAFLTETEVNNTVSRLVWQELRDLGYNVELLDEWDPRLEGYQADALVSIHAGTCSEDYVDLEGNPVSGYWVGKAEARPPQGPDALLVDCIATHYGKETHLGRRYDLPQDMAGYHAFREISATTPGAIIEIGFMLGDRELITERADLVARGIVDGILCYLNQADGPPVVTSTPIPVTVPPVASPILVASPTVAPVIELPTYTPTANTQPLASPTPTGRPTVNIISPQTGSEVVVNSPILMSVNAADSVGVTRVQLLVEGQIARTFSSENALGVTNKNLVIDYTPRTAGSIVLQVIAYRGTVASDPAEITVVVRGSQTQITATAQPDTGGIPTIDRNMDPRFQTATAIVQKATQAAVEMTQTAQPPAMIVVTRTPIPTWTIPPPSISSTPIPVTVRPLASPIFIPSPTFDPTIGPAIELPTFTPIPTVPPFATVAPPTETPVQAGLTVDTIRDIQEQLRFSADSVWAWSPDGRSLAVASESHIAIYETSDLQADPTILEGYVAGPVLSLAFHPSGTILASSSGEGTVRLWDLREGRILGGLVICESSCRVDRVSFSPDGAILAVEAEDTVQLWSLPQ